MIRLVYFGADELRLLSGSPLRTERSWTYTLDHRLAGRLRLRDFPETQKPFVSFAAFCSNSLLPFCISRISAAFSNCCQRSYPVGTLTIKCPLASVEVGSVGKSRVAGPSVTLPFGSKVDP